MKALASLARERSLVTLHSTGQCDVDQDSSRSSLFPNQVDQKTIKTGLTLYFGVCTWVRIWGFCVGTWDICVSTWDLRVKTWDICVGATVDLHFPFLADSNNIFESWLFFFDGKTTLGNCVCKSIISSPGLFHFFEDDVVLRVGFFSPDFFFCIFCRALLFVSHPKSFVNRSVSSGECSDFFTGNGAGRTCLKCRLGMYQSAANSRRKQNKSATATFLIPTFL